MQNRTIFLAGHAKLPQGMAAKSVFETLTITAELDCKYGVIIEASCTLATQHGRDFVGRLLRGYSLREDYETLVKLLQEQYKGKAQNALLAALKDLHAQFEIYDGKKS